MPQVAAYPWGLLSPVPRGAVRAAKKARARLRGAADPTALSRALGELLAGHVTWVVRGMTASGTPPPPGFSVHLRTADDLATVVVGLEPALATTVVARTLGRAPELTLDDTALAPSVRAALAAVLVEAARRSESTLPLVADFRAPSPGDGVLLDVTFFLDDRPYVACVWVADRTPPTGARSSPVELGAVPVRLVMVAAVSEISRAELEALAPGDVFLPGAGWLHDAQPPLDLARLPWARTALSSESGDLGVEVRCSEDGKLVLRGVEVRLGLEANAGAFFGENGGNMSEPNETLREIVLDAPVVVRVEVASVTLSAREWGELRPGDVLETGVNLTEPVVLRVAGREIARGELVNVDGQIGVRVRELTDESRSP